MNVVKFAYYDEFKCTGGECPDSCCKVSWHIRLTKREYLDYKKMDLKPEFREKADKCIKRVKNMDENQYAEILHTDKGCSFLTEDGLCGLQKELGEKALGYVCRTFPRFYIPVGDETVTMSCTNNCYHVNELLINHPEGLEIVESEYHGNGKQIYGSFAINKDWNGYPYYWDILNAEVDILQNRSFTVSERLLILGYFCKKTDEYIADNQADKIPTLASMILDNALCGKIADSLTPNKSDDISSTRSMDIFLKMYIRISGADFPDILKLFDKVKARLNFNYQTRETGQTDFTFSYERYKELCEIYRKIESERPYIIENLLVNQVFIQNMQEGVWLNYFSLAVFYNMLKICAPVFLHLDHSDKELALALTYTVKMLINTHLTDKGTFADFFEENKHTLPYAAFLIC
ncbi:MAG: flagellin lysine-N-methylase [Bacteroides sp.]|nr:flagellin lysine-N-methylase [Bacteroides sp.]